MPFRDTKCSDKKESRLGLKTLPAIAAIASATVLGSCSNEGGGSHAGVGDSDRATEAVPGDNSNVAKMSAAEFNQLSRVEKLNYAAPILNTNMEQTANQFRTALHASGGSNVFERPVAPANVNDTPQQIWDHITLGAYQAWKTAQGGNMEQAKKLASVVAEGNEYNKLVNGLSNPEVLDDEGSAGNGLPLINNGTYGSTDARDYPGGITEFMERSAVDSSKAARVVVAFEKGTAVNSNRWVLVELMPLS